MEPPVLHRRFIDDVLPRIRQDVRVVGVALAGSLAGSPLSGEPDAYSDVDLVVVVEDAAFTEVMKQRLELIGSWADLVVGFTGEHVGEPRLIITLVGPPLLHVDFKFVSRSDFGKRIADPRILFDRDGSLVAALASDPAAAPEFDVQWVEDRFWIWVHYGATKIGRGELFEAISFLSYLRDVVLGPLAALRVGAEPRGLRRLETVAPDEARELRATLCGHDRADVGRAALACVELYRRWMDDVVRAGAVVERRRRAEELAVRYLREVVDQELIQVERG